MAPSLRGEGRQKHKQETQTLHIVRSASTDTHRAGSDGGRKREGHFRQEAQGGLWHAGWRWRRRPKQRKQAPARAALCFCHKNSTHRSAKEFALFKNLNKASVTGSQ